MKIISKAKDYYDYLQGVYGMDELLVYDRRSKEPISKPSLSMEGLWPTHFHICSKHYQVFQYKGKLYHTCEELNKLNKLLSKDGEQFIKLSYSSKTFLVYSVSRWDKSKPIPQKDWDKVNGRFTDMNQNLRQPVLIQNSPAVILEDWGFAKWIPAHDMFVNISSFLGWLKDHPEIPNKQTDKEKLKSHGFDDKKSFRHRKDGKSKL